jgi:hypothetical protein
VSEKTNDLATVFDKLKEAGKRTSRHSNSCRTKLTKARTDKTTKPLMLYTVAPYLMFKENNLPRYNKLIPERLASAAVHAASGVRGQNRKTRFNN